LEGSSPECIATLGEGQNSDILVLVYPEEQKGKFLPDFIPVIFPASARADLSGLGQNHWIEFQGVLDFEILNNRPRITNAVLVASGFR
jgi:hypothetical protein